MIFGYQCLIDMYVLVINLKIRIHFYQLYYENKYRRFFRIVALYSYIKYIWAAIPKISINMVKVWNVLLSFGY